MMGKYLENNVQAFTDMQKKLQDQARNIYGENPVMNKELWSQFLNFQGPAMQSMMGAYVEQSSKMFQQMQDNMQEQTRKLFSGFPIPGYPPADKAGEKK
jgi:polyhydroxyalkanoate synthesis regulator protein